MLICWWSILICWTSFCIDIGNSEHSAMGQMYPLSSLMKGKSSFTCSVKWRDKWIMGSDTCLIGQNGHLNRKFTSSIGALHSMARANLNKSKELVKNTTTASNYIPNKPIICINWNSGQNLLSKSTYKCGNCEARNS